MLNQFVDMISEYVEVKKEAINENSRFVEDLGFNSYDFMSFIGEIEDMFEVEVEERAVVQIKTVQDAMDYIGLLQKEVI